MAGQNLSLQPSQILFQRGDPSDGMYLLRSGQLTVFLPGQDGDRETMLATVGPGGMIGEMALFDHKPRSASVRAVQLSAVTHISQADFKQLMSQIPKWFTALMITLSSRLRSTNERLQELERGTASGDASAVGAGRLLKLWTLLDAMIRLEGSKDSKSYRIQRQLLDTAREQMTDFSAREQAAALAALEHAKVLRQLSSDPSVVFVEDRGLLRRSIEMLHSRREILGQVSLGPYGTAVLRQIQTIAACSAYDPVVIAGAAIESAAPGGQAEGWTKTFDHFVQLHARDGQRVNTSDGGIGFRIDSKLLQKILTLHLGAQALLDAAEALT